MNWTVDFINEHDKEFLGRCNDNITDIDQNLLDYWLNALALLQVQ